MGVVLKQSLQNTLVTYFGFGIGAFNVLILYPKILSPQYYGLVTFLLSAGTLLWPFLGFGLNNTIIRFYSSFKKRDEQNQLLSMVLFYPLGVALILGITTAIFKDQFILLITEDWIKPYFWLIFLIAFAIAYFELFFAWSKLKLKSVFGNFMKEVFHRVLISVLLYMVYIKLLNVTQFLYALTIVYLLRTLIIKLYAFYLLPPKIDLRLPKNHKKIFTYSALMLLASFVASALLDLDKVMIEHFMPIEQVSIYGIGVYMASVIAVPSRAMHQITLPLTAKYLNENQNENLKSLYTKSSINLLVISGFIFLLILVNASEIYRLLPPVYTLAFEILCMLSSIKLLDNLLGISNSIILNSRFYKLLLITGVFVILLAIGLNIYLIPRFGLIGAAVASLIVFLMYDLAKIFMVYKFYKLHPFSRKTFYVIVFIFKLLFISRFLTLPFNPFINLIIQSISLAIVYFIGILFLKPSEELSLFLKGIKYKLKHFQNKKSS
ncbi:polysaccharide biosynthesis C-terminal domain-containing protein [uncultured Mesonia sp.]|uniref:oligosaccharide flippase family protein n=1 Tax=uncultured Mesonia sp. TaxID=399731 RepID=UPI00374F1620